MRLESYVLLNEHLLEDKKLKDLLSQWKDDVTEDIFQNSEDIIESITRSVTGISSDILLRFASCFITLFTRLNWTGPTLDNSTLSHKEQVLRYKAALAAGVLKDNEKEILEEGLGDWMSKEFPVLGHPDSFEFDITIRSFFNIDGEIQLIHVRAVRYLIFASIALDHIIEQNTINTHDDTVKTAALIWKGRECFIRQRVLDTPCWITSPSLKSRSVDRIQNLLNIELQSHKDNYEWIDDSDIHIKLQQTAQDKLLNEFKPVDISDKLKVRLLLELGVRASYYGLHNIVDIVIDQLKELLNVRITLSGVLGTGRVYQEESRSQMVLLTEKYNRVTDEWLPAKASYKSSDMELNRNKDSTEIIESTHQNTAEYDDEKDGIPIRGVVTHEYLDKDTDIYETPKLDLEKDKEMAESPIDYDIQALILLELFHRYERSAAEDKMNMSTLHAFVNRVILGSEKNYTRNENLRSSALWFRCKAELLSDRHRERAVVQLNSLREMFDDRMPSSSFNRSGFIFECYYPSLIDSSKDLANYLLRIGAYQAVYDLYQSLDMKEQAIACLIQLGRIEQAKLETERLISEGEVSSSVLCLMGDITKDKEYYEKAWEESNHIYASAMRRLGHWHYERKNFKEASECYGKALELNPTFLDILYRKACIDMTLREFKTAIKGFTNVIIQNEDNTGAWQNLSRCHAELGQLEASFRSIQQAVRFGRQQFHPLDSYITASLRTGRTRDALNGFKWISELGKLKDVDPKKLEYLHFYLLQDVKNEDLENLINGDSKSDVVDTPEKRLIVEYTEFLKDVVTKYTSNEPSYYKLTYDVADRLSNQVQMYDALQRQYQEMRAKSDSQNNAGQWLIDVDEMLVIIQSQLRLLRFRHEWKGDLSETMNKKADTKYRAKILEKTINNLRSTALIHCTTAAVVFEEQKCTKTFVETKNALKAIIDADNSE